MDIERMLSPTGGYNYGETINSGVAGLGMMFMSGSLFDKFMMNPANAAAKYGMRAERRASGLFDKTDLGPEYTKKRARLESVKNRIGASGKGVARFDEQIKNQMDSARQKIIEDNKKLRKDFTRSQNRLHREWKSKFARGRNIFRAAGWATLISAGLDIAVEAATPGVSKVAAKREEQFMQTSQQMNQGSFTMRQRAVEAIHNSMMNVRNVIGNEAQFMHR
jgi:hypothetical protein